jgi:peptidoglycan-associated lipoprotein
MNTRHLPLILLVLATLLAGCPKRPPQPEIDAATQAMKTLEKSKDCAPEKYAAAKSKWDEAQALLAEEKYEEAKIALLASQKLAKEAAEECEKKLREAEEARKKAEADALAAAKTVQPPPAETPTDGPQALVTVYFGFNEAELSEEARNTLGDNADYMRRRPEQRVQVEGHCDNRGSTEYNLALGERRALSIRQYLIKLGVNPDRLEIISYGEERPVDPASSEEAFSKNRRGEFKAL